MPQRDEPRVLRRNKAVARRMLEAWSERGESHIVDDLISPNLVTHFTRPVVVTAGPKRERELVETVLPREGFPDQQFEEQILIAEDDTVFVAWSLTGTHLGPLYGKKATGQQVTVYGSDVIRIGEDGKIAEHWGFYSKPRAHALARLGLLDQRMQKWLLKQGLLRRGKASGPL